VYLTRDPTLLDILWFAAGAAATLKQDCPRSFGGENSSTDLPAKWPKPKLSEVEGYPRTSQRHTVTHRNAPSLSKTNQ
jgi:hypothetical protein